MNPYLEKVQRGARFRSFKRGARVEIVPLIDVMFLLVAFLMVVTISMVRQKGIFVDLSPAETSDSSLTEENALILSVDESGTFFLNKKEIDTDALRKFFAAKAKESSDTPVVINADKNARHESVIEALDLVRSAGLHNAIFSVEPKE